VTLRAFTKSTTADSSFADLLARTVRKEHGPIHGSGTEANTMPGPGRFAFRFADGGDYAFTFVLARTDGQWSVALPATPAVVAVRAAAGVQTFTFTTDDARLQQALLDLRGH
jgi:hypothetical protein